MHGEPLLILPRYEGRPATKQEIRDMIIDRWLKRQELEIQYPSVRRYVKGKQEPLRVYGFPLLNKDLDQLLINVGIAFDPEAPPTQRHIPAYEIIINALPKRMDPSFQYWRWVHGPPEENHGRMLVVAIATNETWHDLAVASDHAYLRAVNYGMRSLCIQPGWFTEFQPYSMVD
uniref:Uncharacterized protein n=1 Tax=Psilocybe cubensis TaxID=181762 RepID=A0A8H7XL52_PSICU